MSPDPFAQLDGAYSIGALDPDDLAAYEAHLRTCAECRERVERLRPTVRLLAAARCAPDADLASTEVPDTLLPGLLRRAERERARRRWVVRGVAGLAAACLVALIVVLWPPTSTHRPAARALVAVRSSPVEATASLVAKPWGTQVDVHCRYELYARMLHGRYGLRVIDRDQRAYELGTWSLGAAPGPNQQPAKEVTFVGGTAVRRERIARVEITLPDGTPILQLVL